MPKVSNARVLHFHPTNKCFYFTSIPSHLVKEAGFKENYVFVFKVENNKLIIEQNVRD